MNEAELKKFRDDLKNDPELVQELDLHLSIGKNIPSVEEERFRKKLNQAYKVYKIKSKGEEENIELKSRSRNLRYLAGILPVLFGFAFLIYFFQFKKDTNQEIFTEFFSEFNNKVTTRGLTTDPNEVSNLDMGINLYYQGHYPQASQVFSDVLNSNPENSDACFYNGLCFIYLNDFQNSIASFEKVLRLPFSYNQEYAAWYLALCFIRTDNKESAKNILKGIVADDGFLSPKAKRVLRKLR
jgi:tetratricopeptide (TPR) repeat protein